MARTGSLVATGAGTEILSGEPIEECEFRCESASPVALTIAVRNQQGPHIHTAGEPYSLAPGEVTRFAASLDNRISSIKVGAASGTALGRWSVTKA